MNVLQALAERRFDDLPRVRIPAVERQRQLAADLQAALTHLRTVCDSYWDQDWRPEHRGSGHHPEHVLWEAVHGYLDLRDAQDQAGPSSPP